MRDNHLSILNGDSADGFGDTFERENMSWHKEGYDILDEELDNWERLLDEQEFKTKKVDTMTKSKVEKIAGMNPWDGPSGKIIYHNLLMDNGDKISIGKKKELAIGEELSYEITDTKEEYHKAKSVNENFQGGNFTPRSSGKDPLTQMYIIAQSCQDRAVRIVTSNASVKSAEIEVSEIKGITNSLMTQILELANKHNNLK